MDLRPIANFNDANDPPKVFPNYFDSSFLNEQEIISFLQSLSANDLFNQLRPRIYINGELRVDLVSTLATNPPHENESINDWSQRIFQSQDFLILINCCEAHLVKFTERLFDKYVRYIPKNITSKDTFRGVDIVLFIGKYKQTPLRLHNDPNILSVVHFQLTGEKTLYFFDNGQELIDTYGAEANFQDHLEKAEKQIISPNDIITFGGNNFHLGEAKSVSASISLGVSQSIREQLLKDLSESIFEKMNKDILNQDELGPYPTGNEVKSALEKHLVKENLLGKLETTLAENKFLLESNLYFIKKHKRRSSSLKHLLKKNQFQLRKPYRFLYELEHDFISIYMLGHKYQLNKNDSLIDLLEKLNLYKKLNLADHSTEQNLKFLLYMSQHDIWT